MTSRISRSTQIFLLTAIVAILILPTTSLQFMAAHAENPYVGGYADPGTSYHIDRASMFTQFSAIGTGPGNDLLSVLTVAGTSNANGVSGVNGFFYQSVAQWEHSDGNIYNVGQVWGPSCLQNQCSPEEVWPSNNNLSPSQAICLESNSIRVAGSITWINGRTQVSFGHECLKTDGSVSYHSVTYTPVTSPVADNSKYFMAGTYGPCTDQSCSPQVAAKVKFYQFAVESPAPVATKFNALHSQLTFYDTADGLSKRLVDVESEKASYINLDSEAGWYISSTGTANIVTVGGSNSYPNVHVNSQGTDNTLPPGYANWYNDGQSTCSGSGGACYSDGQLLWNGNTGAVSTIGTTSDPLAPARSGSFEGEKRVVLSHDGSTIFAFYYDTGNGGIVEKTSTNGGSSWGSLVSLNTGTLVSDNNRWSVSYTSYQGTQYIYVFYWIQGNPDTGNTHFKFLRGTVSSDGKSISWSSPVELGYTSANTSACGTGGACAAVVSTTDSNGNLYAAFRFMPGGQSDFYYQVKVSTDGGFDWSDSIGGTDTGNTVRPVMVLASLSSGGMLFGAAYYNNNIFYYRVYTSGSGWSGVNTQTISDWTSSEDKQLSADTDPTTGNAYVAYLSRGTSGTLKIMDFTNTGGWNGIETADSSMSTHQLPSIDITADGTIHVYTLAGSPLTVYETDKAAGSWAPPATPYGTSFTSPDQLTSTIWYPNGIWQEGSTAPYNVRFPYGY